MSDRKIIHKAKYIFNLIVILIVITFSLSFECKAEYKEQINIASKDTKHAKKVSLENMVYLKEEQYSLGKYLNNSIIYSKVEEYMNNILNSSKKRIIIEKDEGLSKKQIDTILAVLDAKYFPYYGLDCVEEVSKYSYKVTINVNKAKRLYLKNKNIQDKIDDILFNQLEIDSNTTEYEAVYRINDWMCNNLEYDNTFEATSVTDVILKRVGICCSYTDTFRVFCNRIGIESYCVASDAMSHAWNTVVIDNIEYHIDTTWNSCGYYDSWFLISETEMLKDHYKPNWKDTKRIKVPKHYKLSYILNGGKNSRKNPEYITQSNEIALYKPSKEGYEFKGWFTNSSYTNKVTNTSQLIKSNKIRLYAKWQKIKRPSIKNVKTKIYNKYIRISWRTSQSNKVKYRIKFKSLENTKSTITLYNNSLRINKNKNGEAKYVLSITPYIVDSANKKIYGKEFILENRR